MNNIEQSLNKYYKRILIGAFAVSIWALIIISCCCFAFQSNLALQTGASITVILVAAIILSHLGHSLYKKKF